MTEINLGRGVEFELLLDGYKVIEGKLDENNEFILVNSLEISDLEVVSGLIEVGVETKVPYSSQIESIKISINEKNIELGRLNPDESFFADSYSIEELGLEKGNNSSFTFSYIDSIEGVQNSTSLSINITEIEEEAEIEEQDEHTTHDEEATPIQKTVERAEKNAKNNLPESKQNVVDAITNNKTPLGESVSVLSRSGDYLSLKVDSRVFFEKAKKYKDVNEALQSKKGKAFLEFIKSKGYEVEKISELKNDINLVVKQRKLAVSYKEERKIKSVEALYAFNRVASMLLTEPYLYEESDGKAKAELKRIQDIFGVSVLPSFYQTLELAACGKSHLEEKTKGSEFKEQYKTVLKQMIKASVEEAGKSIDQGLLETAVATTVGGIIGGVAICFLAPIILPVSVAAAATAGGVGAVGTIIAGGGFLAYDLYNSDDNVKHNNKRVKYGISCLSNYLNEEDLLYQEEDILYSVRNSYSFSSNPEADKKQKNIAKDILVKALSKTGEGGVEINGAINLITGRYFSATPSFKHFEDLTYEVGASSALNLLLKPERHVKSERSYDQPTNLYAEQVIGAEASEYLYFLLAFPWYEIPEFYRFNLNEATEVWKESGKNSDGSLKGITLKDNRTESLTYNTSKKDYLRKDTLFNYFVGSRYTNQKDFGQTIYENYFKKRKDSLKRQQEKKITFLLALRDALAQEVILSNATEFYEDPRFKKFVERYSRGSVFQIADTTAYPDIDLPNKFLSAEKINVFSPDFYYFKPEIVNSEKSDIKAVSKLIDKSFEFKQDLRESIVSNKPYEMFKSKPDLTNRNLLTNVGGSKSGLSVPDRGNSVKFKSKTSKIVLNSLSLNEIPFKLSGFKSEEEVETYLLGKQEELVAAEKELSLLRSCIGYKNFEGIISKEEIEERLNKSGSKKKPIIKNLSKLLGFHSEGTNYNNPEELKKLASESNEMTMLNMGMAKAFPTFRFYLVEEDAIYSDKLTVYDDFFSYASVISFNVNSSRELPAATAQIVLQNVSGVLDGSKKEVLRDIDVDSRKLLSNRDDQINNQIESIVLRPGINAQLRAGYSSTCNELDILISGRITEIQHSNDGMTTNITLQSYGVELDKKIEKNLARNNENNKFYSTHQLLGSLILSTQLKHFGRIKTGKIFQDGENKSAALDNRMPNEESKFTYYYSNMFTRTLADNMNLIVYGALGAGLLRFAGGALANRFTIFKTGGDLAKRYSTRGYNILSKIKDVGTVGTGRFGRLGNIRWWATRPFAWTLSTGEAIFKFTRNPSLIRNPWATLKMSFNSNFVRSNPLIKNNKTALNNILAQLKSGKNVADLTKAEQRILEKLTGQISGEIKKDIGFLLNEAGLTEGAARKIAEKEIQILYYAMKEEGLAFQLTGFTAKNFGRAASLVFDTAAKTNLQTGFMKNFAGLLGSYTRSIIQTGAVAFGAGITVGLIGFYLDAVYNTAQGVVNLVKNAFEHIFGDDEDDTLRILLSPQDDNLFLPSSDSYLRKSKEGETKIPGLSYFEDIKLPALNVWRFGTGMVNMASWRIAELVGIYKGDKTFIQERFKEFKSLFDTRLDVSNNENIYFLKGQTIFNVFHEMTLRHPGYVYGARPYGDSMEYRMFFGLPNQRYWAEDISTIDAIRVNKILRDYNADEEGLLKYETCKLYYPEVTSRMEQDLVKMDDYKEKRGYLTDEEIGAYSKPFKIDENNLTEKIKRRIRFKITKQAMDEYINKTRKRFVPFRKMHQIHSSRNLIANNIIVSGHNVINTVSVNYTTLDSSGNEIEKTDDNYRSMYAINLSSNTAIPPELQRPKTYSSENIVGPAAAYRYAIGQLVYGGKEMYQGSVLTLGNPKINPWDVLILNDEVNRMYGPVEVKAVNHMFSHEYGFLTDVEVNALVTFGEDSLTYPTIMSSILGQAKEQIFNRFASTALFEEEIKNDPTFYQDILQDIIENDIGDNASKGFKKALKETLIEALKEEMKKAKEQERPFFLRDVLENDIAIPDEIADEVSDIGSIGLEAVSYYGIAKLLKIAINKRRGLLQTNVAGVRGPFGVGFYAFLAGSAFLTFGTDIIKDNIEDSLNSGRLGKNLFRPVLMSKVSNQSIIEVYPLVKDGKPLVTGGFEGVPASQSYQNVLGNIYPVISDGIKGYLKYRNRLDKKGAESLYTFDEDFIQRKKSKFDIARSDSNEPIIGSMVVRTLVESFN